jgi:hypothetical protein
MARNLALLVVIGVLAGGLIGYLTRPEAASVSLGPVNLEVRTDRVAASGDPLTGSQIPHIAVLAAVGGLVGAGIGLLVQRRT